MGLIQDLKIHVNPNYSWDDPEQFEYVNPVTLANHTIALANAALTMTDKFVNLNESRIIANKALRAAENALEDLENDLLRTHPPSAQDRKSNKLLDIYVRTVAFEHGYLEAYEKAKEAVRGCRDAVEALEIRTESAKQVQYTLKLMGDHIMTHLSYRKHELQHSKYGV